METIKTSREEIPSDWKFCVVEKGGANTILEAAEKLDDYAQAESVVCYNNTDGYPASIISSRHFPMGYKQYTGNLGEYFFFSRTKEVEVPGVEMILLEKAKDWKGDILPKLWICKFVFVSGKHYKDLVFYNL